MKKTRQFFHLISYLQYPLMLTALYFAFRPHLFGYDAIWQDLNKVLIFMGLGISFTTLADTRKTQNKLSKVVYSNPRYTRIFLFYLLGLTFLFLGTGIACMFATIEALNELSTGILVLAAGMIGMIKTALEYAENHGGIAITSEARTDNKNQHIRHPA